MKKPDSYTQFLGILFGLMGPLWLLLGILCRLGIMTASSDSNLDPAGKFLWLGAVLLFVGLFCRVLARYQRKKEKQLRQDGIRVKAAVTGVKHLFFTQWGKESPYRIYFTYSYNGTIYKGKSHLLWEKPEVDIGENLSIYIDSDKNRRYFLEDERF
ncbi:MAG: hypothetical protein ACOCM4_01475 [Acetivibrio ethanolgignens]